MPARQDRGISLVFCITPMTMLKTGDRSTTAVTVSGKHMRVQQFRKQTLAEATGDVL